jgi:AraC-like DNA-binding protein
MDCGNLDRVFRNKHGIPVKRFIDDQRRKYLIRLVANNNQYGYELASQIGIANDHTFYRWVKKQFGVSYSVLRETVRSEKKSCNTFQS